MLCLREVSDGREREQARAQVTREREREGRQGPCGAFAESSRRPWPQWTVTTTHRTQTPWWGFTHARGLPGMC